MNCTIHIYVYIVQFRRYQLPDPTDEKRKSWGSEDHSHWTRSWREGQWNWGGLPLCTALHRKTSLETTNEGNMIHMMECGCSLQWLTFRFSRYHVQVSLFHLLSLAILWGQMPARPVNHSTVGWFGVFWYLGSFLKFAKCTTPWITVKLASLGYVWC